VAAVLLLVGMGAGAMEAGSPASDGGILEARTSRSGGPWSPSARIGQEVTVEASTSISGVPPSDAALSSWYPASSQEAQPIQGGPGTRPQLDTPLLARLRSVIGLLVLSLLAWLFSVDRRSIAWRVVIWGLALQFAFAFIILKTPVGLAIFDLANDVVVALLGFTVDGARFIFGDLVWNNVPVGTGMPGTNAPMMEAPGQVARTGAYFAFNVLPTIIFFSSLMTVLYHLGVMQLAVKGVAWVMQKTMRTSGAETLSAAGNIFVGQTEAPLLIKPFVESMTMSELMAVMTGGFATVAGGVMAAYVGMLLTYFPDIAGHLMAASVMSAPAALVCAKLMYPEDGEPRTKGTLAIEVEKPDVNTIDAAARGAHEGLHLALNVGAMLLAFVALIFMANALIGWAAGLAGIEGLTLEKILGWVLAPLAWLMGVPWQDASTVASLMGVKTVLNEFFAYLQLSSILSSGALEPRSVVIVTYALSGFANFSSIAIQLGGIGGIAPSRRHDLSRIGLRAMIAGSIAAFMTATVAGALL
jgi:CNT family concentrative nucleoside transporter